MKEETVKVKETYRRFLTVDELKLERADNKPRTIEFSLSSEEPYERWFGTEVLVHESGTVRLERAKQGAMPLLFNHNMNDPIGMIQKMWLEDNRTMVKAQLFDSPRANEVVSMIEGGLRNVSVGYRIHKIEENKDSEVFRVTDWEPFEGSIVTVPADPTVGIGREYDVRMLRQDEKPPAEAGAEAITRRADMPDDEKKAAAGSTTVEPANKEMRPVDYEERRLKAIKNLCMLNRLDEKYEAMFIGQGLSVEDVSDEIIKIHEHRSKSNPKSIAKLGLGGKETERFSWMKAITAILNNDWKDAGFELECSREIARRTNKVLTPSKFFVPYEVQQRSQEYIPRNGVERMRLQRDLTVASGSGGGFLVETTNMGFIDMLRNRSVAFRMGARRLSGLVGSVNIPRQSAAGTMFWLATESTAVTESQQTFEQVPLSPNNAAAYTEVSRQLLLQSSPGAEEIVVNDLSSIVAIGLDKAVLHGSGTEQPQGIVGASGVLTVGSGPTISYATFLEAQSDVAGANVMPSAGGYVTTPALAAQSMQRVKFTSTASPLWEGNLWDGSVTGFPAMSSNQVNSGIVIFGDWAEILVAEWGVLEIDINPYANFQAGIVGIRCMYSVDVGIRRPAAFSTLSSAV